MRAAARIPQPRPSSCSAIRAKRLPKRKSALGKRGKRNALPARPAATRTSKSNVLSPVVALLKSCDFSMLLIVPVEGGVQLPGSEDRGK